MKTGLAVRKAFILRVAKVKGITKITITCCMKALWGYRVLQTRLMLIT